MARPFRMFGGPHPRELRQRFRVTADGAECAGRREPDLVRTTDCVGHTIAVTGRYADAEGDIVSISDRHDNGIPERHAVSVADAHELRRADTTVSRATGFESDGTAGTAQYDTAFAKRDGSQSSCVSEATGGLATPIGRVH